jgi:glycogen debranching enzyme
LYEIIKEALTTHFQGLMFTERNAGTEIDAHMKTKGFHIQIGIDPETGFVFGGNDANCGTWMDKMGSSDKAGNRGNPTTPRDGTAVELVGLQYAVLRFLSKMSDERQIPFGSVERTSQKGKSICLKKNCCKILYHLYFFLGVRTVWTFAEWADRIKTNFEKCFYVDQYTIGKYVNKREIYKDSFNATAPWNDFQLRCNFPIAMVSVGIYSDVL